MRRFIDALGSDAQKRRDYPEVAERAFRDIRISTLMPATVDRMLEAIGKQALGLPAGMFRIGGRPQGA